MALSGASVAPLQYSYDLEDNPSTVHVTWMTDSLGIFPRDEYFAAPAAELNAAQQSTASAQTEDVPPSQSAPPTRAASSNAPRTPSPHLKPPLAKPAQSTALRGRDVHRHHGRVHGRHHQRRRAGPVSRAPAAAAADGQRVGRLDAYAVALVAKDGPARRTGRHSRKGRHPRPARREVNRLPGGTSRHRELTRTSNPQAPAASHPRRRRLWLRRAHCRRQWRVDVCAAADVQPDDHVVQLSAIQRAHRRRLPVPGRRRAPAGVAPALTHAVAAGRLLLRLPGPVPAAGAANGRGAAGRARALLRGPASGAASRHAVERAGRKELSKDFFRNMRDLQNSMADFTHAHDKVVDLLVPVTNFSDEALSSTVFLLLFTGGVLTTIAAHVVPWRLVALVGGWALVLGGHPSVKALVHAQRRQHLEPREARARTWLDRWIADDDVLPPQGWEWSEKKWALDLWSREWVEERIITGVEVETEGERWVYDMYDERDDRTGVVDYPDRPKVKNPLQPSWEEGEDGSGRRGEWRRRRWVRLVKRKAAPPNPS
ncbi:hypothetical protein HIM_04404 [Hirsutella minnesotensis 3608]|uniref:TECPR1-like DysF domain-containing protein n=1 Tax=Hirsutella minnesotensis 3608 TaxID=1043627 RepID=A0A0F8A1L8_9HYPO|nr:hypothetical protein HIM_04404 [Hirsutella minnesotensis 3608]